MLPIYLKNEAVPIVELTVRQLKKLECDDVAVVLGDFRSEDIITFVHKYIKPKYNMNFTYFYQGEPLGIAHAVAQAKDFVKGEEEFIVLLGDNCFLNGISFAENNSYRLCSIIFSETNEPQRYGSPFFKDDGTLYKVVEKPKEPQKNLALAGLYLFNTKFYFDTFKTLQPSARGEYELTDIVNQAIEKSPSFVHWTIYKKGFWMDAGTFPAIYELTKKLNEVEK